MTNTSKMHGGFLIQRTRIIGTKIVAFTAWEVDHGDHSTITHVGGVRYGRVGTTRIPAELDALRPGSDERYERVHAFIAADRERAYEAILAACPEARDGRRDGMGEIEVIVP